ncbi:MAG TPA: RagB/SusD family nutrient uptake outer membrane protein [Pseudobacter sp.]|nr:RagB/SusD family nutrient uptake outer membrane protein [Pseudobacter sp.]
MNIRKNIIILVFSLIGGLTGCKKYLDVVPDNVATIENAFTLRASAEKYLFTCFSYLPRDGHFNTNPGFATADEVWYMFPSRDIGTGDGVRFWNIARGGQNVSSPLGNYWEGTNGGRPLFTGIRDCNIFLDNIHKVPDMDDYEKERWKGEVIFLKAYYHFLLTRSYGPIPLIRSNLPIESETEEMRYFRSPVDSCFNYIVELLDQADANDQIPDRINGTEAQELGRITRAIIKSVKAKVLITAASPLFNGNADYAGFKDSRGVSLFPSYSADRWTKAEAACKEAIEFCESNGYMLYTYNSSVYPQMVAPIQVQLDLRGAVTDKETSNQEVIWANPNSRAGDLQRWSMPLIKAGTSGSGPKGIIAPPVKMAEMFYTKNGVPISQDITWPYNNRFNLRKSVFADRFYVGVNEETVELHYDREPRFYASLGFDRAIWWGNWNKNFDSTGLAIIRARKGETAARQGISNYSISGYWIKKLVALATVCADDGAMTTVQYPWPELRLADLYLLYSEALNEVHGPTEETFKWINKVRTRAGIPIVQDAWSQYARENAKYTSKEGLREIIQMERANELAFEGHRNWDLRRWKRSHIELNAPIKGWDIEQKDAAAYYREVVLYNQNFRLREYLWPLSVNELLRNRNFVQNPGW